MRRRMSRFQSPGHTHIMFLSTETSATHDDDIGKPGGNRAGPHSSNMSAIHLGSASDPGSTAT